MTAAPEFGTQGTALWDAVVGHFELADHELVALRSACAHADMIARLEGMLSESLVVKGAAGQDRLSPAVTELRQGRLALSKLLADLSLPIEEAAGDVKLASPAARKASKAARSRHDRDRLRQVRAGEGA